MLYIYDKAIAEDLRKSFNPDVIENPIVKVFEPENLPMLLAQMQEDSISFPVVALSRSPDIEIDEKRYNFTRAHKGVASVLDNETNELYYEKSIPIKLSYKLSVLTTNTADMDELIRELVFKFTSMYFITITLPYECKRKIRFGVSIPPGTVIERDSGSSEYTAQGKLYEAIIPLVCEGCVIVSYTPAKLKRTEYDIQTSLK